MPDKYAKDETAPFLTGPSATMGASPHVKAAAVAQAVQDWYGATPTRADLDEITPVLFGALHVINDTSSDGIRTFLLRGVNPASVRLNERINAAGMEWRIISLHVDGEAVSVTVEVVDA